jgi:lysozyme
MPNSIVPNSRPQLTKEDAIKIISTSIYYDEYKDGVMLLGLRGYYKKTMGNPLANDFGIYDDAIIVIGKDEYATFNANTDPSVKRPGIAQLKIGDYLYRRGDHHIGKPNAYPAFRPATKNELLPVLRNGKDDFGQAINIHKGSTFSTSSEGCQTIFPAQYDYFQHWVYSLIDKYNQKGKIPYSLRELS